MTSAQLAAPRSSPRLLVLPLLGLALSFAGCCCPPRDGLREVARSVETDSAHERRFVVLRATPLGATEEGKRQLLLEASVISVPRGGVIPALDAAERLDTAAAPAWLAGTQVPDASFGARSAVMEKPSVVTTEGEDATIQVAESLPSGAQSTSELEVTSSYAADGAVRLALRYERAEAGVVTWRVPSVMLRGPAGRVFIVEAKRGVRPKSIGLNR